LPDILNSVFKLKNCGGNTTAHLCGFGRGKMKKTPFLAN
jgi:hypothetical protein